MVKLITVILSIIFLTVNICSQDLIYQSGDISISVWPISGSNTVQDGITDGYGPRLLGGSYDFHRGIDIAQPKGTGVHAPLAGEVARVRPFIESGPDSTTSLRRFGNFVVIAHDSLTDSEGVKRARQTAYLHLDTILVTEGQMVPIGDTVGLVGNSGDGINTEHLHFEYYVDVNNGAINRENSRNPIRLLNYAKTAATADLEIIHDDSLKLTIGQDDFSVGLTRIRLETDTGVDKTIDFETRDGIDIDNEDDNTYGNVLISPENFTTSSDSFFLSITYHSTLNGGAGWSTVSNAIVTLYSSQDDSAKYYFPASALPIELVSFNASLTDNNVLLHWVTETEVNNYGFEISRTPGGIEKWQLIGFLPGAGNSDSPKEYSFTDRNPERGYLLYRLKQIDTDGAYVYSQVISVETQNFASLPTVFKLSQNYPNPFNPATNIDYSIPTACFAQIKVFDILGKEVAVLLSEYKQPGDYSVKFNAGGLSSGIYFIQMSNDNGFISREKMLLLK